jgi:hypothetical protein
MAAAVRDGFLRWVRTARSVAECRHARALAVSEPALSPADVAAVEAAALARAGAVLTETARLRRAREANAQPDFWTPAE